MLRYGFQLFNVLRVILQHARASWTPRGSVGPRECDDRPRAVYLTRALLFWREMEGFFRGFNKSRLFPFINPVILMI